MIQMLTKVCRVLAYNYSSYSPSRPETHNLKQISSVTTTLTKAIRFHKPWADRLSFFLSRNTPAFFYTDTELNLGLLTGVFDIIWMLIFTDVTCIRISDIWITRKLYLIWVIFDYLAFSALTWPSALWRCWLGVRKGIRPVKIRLMRCWRGYLLQRSANSLHMVQLMPLPPHHVCFSKIQNGLSFWYRLTW